MLSMNKSMVKRIKKIQVSHDDSPVFFSFNSFVNCLVQLIEPLEIEIPTTKTNDIESNNVSYHKDKKKEGRKMSHSPHLFFSQIDLIERKRVLLILCFSSLVRSFDLLLCIYTTE